MNTKLLLLFSICIVCLQTVIAQQTNREIIEINDFSIGNNIGLIQTQKGISPSQNSEQAQLFLEKIEVPINANPFIAYSVTWQAENWSLDEELIWYRFYEDEGSKGEWNPIHLDSHAERKGNKWISELMFENKQSKFLDFKIDFPTNSDVLLKNVNMHFYSPGKSIEIEYPPIVTNSKTVGCTCPIPDFETRQDWCPAGNCPPNPAPSNTTVTHLIVHHSAGTNASSDWAGVVRSIWDYHVNTNGWSDIGYNYLVDPNGVLYEGRGDNILGAHFCGNNTGTMGVCVMGDFTNISPSDDAKTTLTDLLSWKACDIDADPLGSSFHASSSQTLNHISGHKDGCSTACPGDTFYPELPTIRQNVSDNINDNCTVVSLEAPSNLEATVVSSTSIELAWQDNSINEASFIVERSINNNSNYQEIASTGANSIIFIDENLIPNTAYFYKVKAANAQEVSDYSNEIGIATVITNLQDLQNELGINVFPNPVKDVLNLSAKDNQMFNLKLLDYTGRLIKEDNWSSSYQLDMTNLTKGVYIIKLSNGRQTRVVKIIF